MPSHRTHRQSSASSMSTCKVGRCSFSGPQPVVIKHEVQEHLLRRFFCCVCDKTLSSFESLRTHANSQHFRNRLFRCETCHTTYLDPARLAKCRKRHRGQYRCPQEGCAYHNARKNSVVRHLKTGHHRTVTDDDEIPFDAHLSSSEPPRMRRVSSATGSPVSAIPGADIESLLGIASQGPSDDELFRLSEEKRRIVMEQTKKEHAEWLGGEEALLAAVPDYPVWSQREHPYGRAPSIEPESSPSVKNDDDSASPELSDTPELLVSSPDEVDASHVPTTLRDWTQAASSTSAMPTASASSGLIMPPANLFFQGSTPHTPATTAISPAWSTIAHSYSDSIIPNFNASIGLSPLSPIPDACNVPALEPCSALFSPTLQSSPLPSPNPWPREPLTPHKDHFLNATLYEHPSSAIYALSDDSSACSQDSSWTSPDPTYTFLTTAHYQAHLVQDVKAEASSIGLFDEWFKASSET